MALALTSSAFAHNGAIPKQYTCQGTDISVPLAHYLRFQPNRAARAQASYSSWVWT